MRKVTPLALCLVFAGLMTGCRKQLQEPIRLTLVSPHRDEIRQEYGLAFQDWFRERTEQRVERTRNALADWLDHPDQRRASAVTESCQFLLEDWNDKDLADLPAVFAGWREQSSANNGRALLSALESWHNQPYSLDLVWQDVGGGTSQIVRYVAARFGENPQGIGVDLVFGGGTDIYLRMADQGWLEKVAVSPAILGRIPPRLNGVPLYDEGGRWYAPMVSSSGILFNRRVLRRIGQPEPHQWADLGQPGLQSWVAAGDPRMSGSVHLIYEIILQRPFQPPERRWQEGFRLLMRLAANAHSFLRESGILTRMVTSGEVAAAGNLDTNALPAREMDPEGIDFWLPPHETVISPDAVAVLKGAPQGRLAKAFVEFTLSDSGQKLIMLRPGEPGGPRFHALGRLCVVKQLYDDYPPETRAVGSVNPFALGDTLHYDNKLGVSRWDAVNDLFGAWAVDAHSELSAAWQGVLRSSLPEPERRQLEDELFAPPVSETELAAHAKRIVNDSPRVRTAVVTGWGEEARQRYRRITREARR